MAEPSENNELAAAWARKVENPHIVLIIVDTLRKDRLGCYGHDRNVSPNIDRLSDSSIVYDNAFSQAPWTLPSVAALLTSRYPSELGIRGFNRRIPDTATLLPEVLSSHGYSNHAVVSNDFVSAKWGFDQGFDSFQSLASGHRTISATKVTDAALQLVERFEDGPTFLMVHYFDPHFLYIEHPSHRFSGPPPDPGSQWWLMPIKRLRYQARKGNLSEAQRDHLLDLYDSEIAYTDQQIGRLLDALEGTGLLGDSIVVFTADHGEEFLDHGGMGHTTTLYNELINVPLIVKWPGTHESQRSARFVAHVDLVPTLLDYLGVPAAADQVGMHLGQRSAESPIISETFRYSNSLTAVIQEGTKLVFDGRKDHHRFFDLPSDPTETAPVSAPENQQALLGNLKDYLGRGNQVSAGTDQATEIEITEDELEKLRALGYVD